MNGLQQVIVVISVETKAVGAAIRNDGMYGVIFKEVEGLKK